MSEEKPELLELAKAIAESVGSILLPDSFGPRANWSRLFNLNSQTGDQAVECVMSHLKTFTEMGPLRAQLEDEQIIEELISHYQNHAERCDFIANRPMADWQKQRDLDRVAALQRAIALRAQLDEAQALADRLRETLVDLRVERAEAQAALREAREVLEWYGDTSNHWRKVHAVDGRILKESKMTEDRGNRARALLEKLPKQ